MNRRKKEDLVRQMLQYSTSTLKTLLDGVESTTFLALSKMSVDGFNLFESLCFLGSQGVSADERSLYRLSNATEAVQVLLHSDAGIATYWMNKIFVVPRLSKFALRILATPASSSLREHDFRVLKTMLLSRRTLFKDENINGVLLLRSFLTKQ